MPNMDCPDLTAPAAAAPGAILHCNAISSKYQKLLAVLVFKRKKRERERTWTWT